ncbi:COP23 domain-containing protein [Crocosphaera sp.]|uniref:COP23 domain-containing protein n=1 Tax=Crocosphaera sp. TaxID=2729996 RepID=UPI00261B3E43|nr:COP23 domain-containing protein [Crocosphaera sp.]MDJ0578703.1 COP23 domain-containing protein [Crocosphaera sp.]
MLYKASAIFVLGLSITVTFTNAIQSNPVPSNISVIDQEVSGDNNNLLLAQNSNRRVEFICRQGYDKQSEQEQYTTYAWTSKGKQAVVRWVKDWHNNSEWTPQKRCEAVSSRFQEAYDNGSIKYIANGWENNQPVICTARERGGDCVTTLITLRPEDDPIEMTTKVVEKLNGRGGMIRHSATGQSQQYYEIDFDRFLRLAPVEDKTPLE